MFYFNLVVKSYEWSDFVISLMSERAFWNSHCNGAVDCCDVLVHDDDSVFSMALGNVESQTEGPPRIRFPCYLRAQALRGTSLAFGTLGQRNNNHPSS